MAEEIQEAVQIIRVAYDGIEIAMKVGSGGIAAMQKAIDFLKGMLDYEKSLGKTSMRKLLLKGGDLQVLQFNTEDMKKVEKMAKKYGILYSVLPDCNRKDGLSEVIFHTEAVPRVNMMIQKLKFGKIATFDDYLKNGDEKSLGKLMDFLKKQQGNEKSHTIEGDRVNSAIDGLIEKVGMFAMEKKAISVDQVKENFSINGEQAESVIRQLETIGVLGSKNEDGTHTVMMDKDAFINRVRGYQDLAERMRAVAASKNANLSDVTISAAYEAHSFEDPTWTWDGHDSATADFRCSFCDFECSLTAQGDAITYETTTEPTYTTEGKRVYTASVTMNGVTYTSDITETLEKTSRKVEVTYIDLKGIEKTVSATRIVGDETDLESGWYAVVDSVTNNNRISNNGKVHGGVNLILCDGATFTNPEGMSVNGARSLTVWGQSAGTGTWNITEPPTSCAGIGGYINASGNITINGGVINVTGAQNAAGIGAGGFAPDSQGVITINGGTVNAKGGHSGAGIGGGNADNSYAGRVIINGGNVTATGNSRGAGIGSGRQSYADVIISGGTVKAVEGNFASVGIGGSGSTVTLTYTDDVSITSTGYDGTVTLEQPFTDGTNVFEAGVVDDNSVLADTTLRPSGGIGVRLAGHSISLDGDIAVNFYMELSDSVIERRC